MLWLIVFLLVAGLILAYAPIEPKIRNFAVWIVIIFAIIWLLKIIL